MDGLELARRIHVNSPQTPIILVTGHGPIDGGQDVCACLSKDELFPALIDKIKSCLGQTGRSPVINEPPMEKAG